MNEFFLAIAVVISINAFICLYRGVAGPTIQDRLIGVNIVGTKTLVVLLLISFVTGHEVMYLDISMVYALLNFVVTLALSRYIETERGAVG